MSLKISNVRYICKIANFSDHEIDIHTIHSNFFETENIIITIKNFKTPRTGVLF